MIELRSIAADPFQYGQFVPVGLMFAWMFALWKGYPFTRRLFFRVIPFILGIALFSLAFYSERFH